MLQFDKFEKKVKVKGHKGKNKSKIRTHYRIFVDRGYGYSMGNMLEVLSGNAVNESNWIEVEFRRGCFLVVDDNMTKKKGDSIIDDTDLGFSNWDESVVDLDNGQSDKAQCFGMSTKLKWNEVIMSPEEFSAPSIERLCEALEHVGICAWHPGDI